MFISIQSKSKLQKIRVYNNLQQLVFELKPTDLMATIDFSSWQAGLYFVDVIDEVGARSSIKVIKD